MSADVLAIVAFLVGGFAVELAHSVHCSLIQVSRVRLKWREVGSHG
jgi:hypothetical protein